MHLRKAAIVEIGQVLRHFWFIGSTIPPRTGRFPATWRVSEFKSMSQFNRNFFRSCLNESFSKPPTRLRPLPRHFMGWNRKSTSTSSSVKITFENTSQVYCVQWTPRSLFTGRANVLFLHFSWRAQHLINQCFHFSWQAQHLVTSNVLFCGCARFGALVVLHSTCGSCSPAKGKKRCLRPSKGGVARQQGHQSRSCQFSKERLL